ncbi:MAG: AMP-binding protein, partial [Oscillospiraceae bacterium]
MNIFDEIFAANSNNLSKQAMSITPDSGISRAYTYQQMFDGACAFLAQLCKAGIRAGDRVILAAENSPEWDIAWLAVLQLH